MNRRVTPSANLTESNPPYDLVIAGSVRPPSATCVRPAPSSLFRCLDPFRRASPERVAVLGAKETERADLGCPPLGWCDGQVFRLDRKKPRAQQFDRRSRRPGIIGKAQRSHRPAVVRKILHRL